MPVKESIGIVPSRVADAKGGLAGRDEMANAKEFDIGNVVVTRALKCTNRPRPGPCLGPRPPPGTPSPCLIPPKCPGPRPRPNFR